MASFDLHMLGWRDFQHLCLTVTREVLGQTVASFVDTKDAGRDGAFFGTWSPSGLESYQGNFVIQAKHTALPNKSLTLSLVAEELKKAESLVNSGLCDVYVLMSNARLTGESEQKIRDALISRGVKQVLILGHDWFNQTISASGRLRILVPRLYGLGDLTQILDERAYGQAAAVLGGMRTDLAKLVRTETYERAAEALDHHGFVLLSGAPMTGKTTIAAELALAAVDIFDTRVVALQDSAELPERWNPNERQFFWLDDAFGATQLNQFLASSWQRATPRVKAAIESGSKFVLTSRDYVLQSAWPYLKPGTFPLLEGARVVVDVADLTLQERQQILYNHLKHGRQDEQFLMQLRPHLDGLASHPGFRPELARRLAEPTFTTSMGRPTAHKLDRFFEQPLEMLESIFEGLDTDSQAALGLLFLGRGWLSSPIEPDDRGEELMRRLGASLGGVTSALDALNGSLVTVVPRDSDQGWAFAHPTMADAYAKLLQKPEFLHLLIGGFTTDALLNQTTCGDMGVENALVVPRHLWPAVMERLTEPLRGTQAGRQRVRREHYLAYQCVPDFQLAYFEQFPDLLESLAEPGLMLEGNPHNAIVEALHRKGVLPEAVRQRFASRLIEYCIEGIDAAVLWSSRLRDLLNDEEERVLLQRLRNEVIADPRRFVDEFTSQHSDGEDPEDFSFPLDQLADALEREFPGKVDAVGAAARIRDQRMDWIATNKPPSLADGAPTGTYRAEPSIPVPASSERSVFDDLVPS